MASHEAVRNDCTARNLDNKGLTKLFQAACTQGDTPNDDDTILAKNERDLLKYATNMQDLNHRHAHVAACVLTRKTVAK